MSSIAEKKIANSPPPQKKSGLITYEEAVELIQSMMQMNDYNQSVSGRVVKVYSNQSKEVDLASQQICIYDTRFKSEY